MAVKGNKSVIWHLIEESGVIVITTHIRPDGDGVASELALFMILKSMGKDVYILNQDKTPDMYMWLPNADKIMTVSSDDAVNLGEIDLTVLLDCSSRDRIGRVYNYIKDAKKIISLDHHENSDCYKDSCYIDTDASSIGELLYDLIPGIRTYLNKDISTCIYVSILTDTGSFAYSNTTKSVFHIVSKLLNYGVNPDTVFQMVYNNKRINHFKLLGKALEQMKTDPSGKVVYVILPFSFYHETGAIEEDNEGILEVIRGLKNIELVILLRQLDEYRFKGSLRSFNNINCNLLAKKFGGGGHFKASGFVIEGDINKEGNPVVQKIIKEVQEQKWL
jgi:phosphoesterase RecJ-like protein